MFKTSKECIICSILKHYWWREMPYKEYFFFTQFTTTKEYPKIFRLSIPRDEEKFVRHQRDLSFFVVTTSQTTTHLHHEIVILISLQKYTCTTLVIFSCTIEETCSHNRGWEKAYLASFLHYYLWWRVFLIHTYNS